MGKVKTKKIWNPKYKEARDLLDPYIDLDRMKWDKSLNSGTHFVRDMAAGGYPLVLKKGRTSYFYSFDSMFEHLVGKAGEPALERILPQIGRTWADVYKIVDENRISGLICTHNPSQDEIEKVVEIMKSGADQKPSEILSGIRDQEKGLSS